MAKQFKSKRAELNSAIYNLSKGLSPSDEPKFAFINAYVKLYGAASEDLSIKNITEEQAEAVLVHLRNLKTAIQYRATDTAPLPPPQKEVGEESSEGKISPKEKRALISIFNLRYDGKYDKIFAGLKKYASEVLERMRPADVRNTYLPAFFKEITFDEAHQLIKRFDQVRKGEKKNEK